MRRGLISVSFIVVLLMVALASIAYGQTNDPPPQEPILEKPVPQQTSTSLPRLLRAPRSGHFHHNPWNSFYEYDPAVVSVKNLAVLAVFQNPYSRRGQGFAYGLRVRVPENLDDNPSVDFYMNSIGYWRLKAGDISHSGYTPIRTRSYSLNSMYIEVVGEEAEIYINGIQLENSDGDERMSIGSDTVAGDVWIVNGPWNGTVQDGAITHYDAFSVIEIDRWSASGTRFAEEYLKPYTQDSGDTQDFGGEREHLP